MALILVFDDSDLYGLQAFSLKFERIVVLIARARPLIQGGESMPISGPTSDHELIKGWANTHSFVPAERLPARVDGEPAELSLVSAIQAESRKDVVVIAWEDFFAKFDQHGLAFVYDNDSSSGFNEILQNEEKSPYRHPNRRPNLSQA